MKRTSTALAAAAALALGALAGAQAPAQPGALTMPQQPQIINLSLLEALVSVSAQDLAGIFAYIPEANAPAAFAHYLLHNKKALKRFLAKGEKDLKEIGCVSEWDRQAFLYALGLHSSGALGEAASERARPFIGRISILSLAPAMPLSEMTLRRKTEK